MAEFIEKIVAWITAGYPEGVPGPDRVPLFALLKRRLTDDEVKEIASAIISDSELDDTDINVFITKVTNELPSDDDVRRVRERLSLHGWPFDDRNNVIAAEEGTQ